MKSARVYAQLRVIARKTEGAPIEGVLGAVAYSMMCLPRDGQCPDGVAAVSRAVRRWRGRGHLGADRDPERLREYALYERLLAPMERSDASLAEILDAVADALERCAREGVVAPGVVDPEGVFEVEMALDRWRGPDSDEVVVDLDLRRSAGERAEIMRGREARMILGVALAKLFVVVRPDIWPSAMLQAVAHGLDELVRLGMVAPDEEAARAIVDVVGVWRCGGTADDLVVGPDLQEIHDDVVDCLLYGDNPLHTVATVLETFAGMPLGGGDAHGVARLVQALEAWR